MNERKHSIMRPIAIAILTTMATGVITAFASMYTDINKLKIREDTLEEKVDSIGSDIKQIKWFLIERNSGNIEQKKR